MNPPEPDNPHGMKYAQHWVNRIEFPPSFCKVRTIRVLVVIILEKLSQHKKIQGHGILRMVVIVVILITVLVPAPVDDGAVHGAHDEMDRQE